MFGRAAEEPAAARDPGIDAEIVPGITAACAAAAQTGTPLTERDGLLRQGMLPSTPVTIAVDVSKPAAGTVSCGLRVLPETLELHEISGCAAIVVRYPKLGSGQIPLQTTKLCRNTVQPEAE
ncbi:SAM-dependent methyltransferase [Leisingera aquaemixtae]|uniref:SAM-dependent methyltransferase n=1 Tax=Leisingera aquaemixtae TaxID=1396826 RepID=UPI002882DCD6|nr:SAM-dependent methyltransferase [Leisingera aquaemixtae]